MGFFNGKDVWPRKITEKDTALKIHKNPFCFFWKSNVISFNKGIEDELKQNFKVIDNLISNEHVKSFLKNDYKPKKVQSPIINTVV